MTVIVGLRSDEGSVLAADREESDGYIRYQGRKIQGCKFPNGLVAAFGGDGNAHFIDFSIQKLKEAFVNRPRLPKSDIGAVIEKTLTELYEDHIFKTNLPKGERPDFGLMISTNYKGENRLFKTQLAAPLEIQDCAASGGGDSYAEILLRKHYGNYDLKSAALFCLYVIHQTQKHICTVGGGTDIVVIKSNGQSMTLTSSLTKPLEEALERLDHEFAGALFCALYADTWRQNAEMLSEQISKASKVLEDEINRLFEVFSMQ